MTTRATGSLASVAGMPPARPRPRHRAAGDRPWRTHARQLTVLAAAVCVLGVAFGAVVVRGNAAQGSPSAAARRVAAGPHHHVAPSGPRLSAAQIAQIARSFFLAPAPAREAADPTATPVAGPSTTPTSPTPPTAPATTSPPASGPAPLAPSPGAMNQVQTYVVGQSGTLWDPDKMVPLASITVSAPQFATSDAAGATAQFGYFATFTVTVTDIAPPSSADTIDPSDSDYYVAADGIRYGFGQSDMGNTAKAERDDALGTDVGAGGLGPGQSTTGTVTVDVPSRHGSIAYAPEGTALGVWNF